ncbi:MAG: hypothetical protein A3E98_04195 [Candidatus Doudnabacteria bacterium RIFCSPHIGHO2_12_FULL_48_11]|uniref:Type II secretion system protein n=1 Tax=Candidatus Doudnabacteria bacterium RIFCSPHIGHO2_01_FULL_46_24 TaxID=1817825 RepID=A0A1F5NVB4_9BACT|nr:MAG: hypothetical protein A2720_00730 [Candidatus Doudnabacteria bacterium RIFCSPHIGHO2_01_FULL_46_24]OGE95994.1 MAG: hypothetical protein A3E98_04195 [Candidatus Doudnabacteria bacterium RIFCSPHIGHO2_12_FULL_48_11]
MIEAVVSSAVFAFAVVSVLGIYALTIRLDSKSRAERAVAENARFILEYLAKSIRNGTIDYSRYPGSNANNSSDSVWFINQANENEHIYLDGSAIKLEKTSVTNLNSSGVRVTDFKLLASPASNPLTSAKLANQQPSLTVMIELSSNYGQKVGDITVLNIQTTLTSRDYPSRDQ